MMLIIDIWRELINKDSVTQKIRVTASKIIIQIFIVWIQLLPFKYNFIFFNSNIINFIGCIYINHKNTNRF